MSGGSNEKRVELDPATTEPRVTVVTTAPDTTGTLHSNAVLLLHNVVEHADKPSATCTERSVVMKFIPITVVRLPALAGALRSELCVRAGASYDMRESVVPSSEPTVRTRASEMSKPLLALQPIEESEFQDDVVHIDEPTTAVALGSTRPKPLPPITI